MLIDPSFLFTNTESGAYNKYVKSSSFLTENDLATLYAGIMQNAYLSMGAGNFNNSMQLGLSKIDKFKSGLFPIHTEQVGYTFITRPRLNLSDGNIRLNRIINSLETTDVKTGGQYVRNLSFMIRCLLDTQFTLNHATAASRSPLVDIYNPFLTPLCNCLTGISGWPDLILDVETTEGGFHQEDMSFAKGSDLKNKTIELTLDFKDMQGGVVMAITYMWHLYMALQCLGEVMAYDDDIYQQRINYSVSIYRFVMDPSKNYITKWARAVGCFPKAIPIGACFNFSENDRIVEASRRFSIPFQAHWPKYNDYAILKDFNRLMRRYTVGIDTGAMEVIPNDLEYNYLGYPYIVDTNKGFKLEFRSYTQDITDFNNSISPIASLVSTLQTKQKANKNSLVVSSANDEIYDIDKLTT